MKSFDNAEFLFSQIEKECNLKRMPKEIYKLIYFTTKSRVFKTLDSMLPFFNIKKKDKGYIFHYNKKDYCFEILSEKKILLPDKKNLQDKKERIKKCLSRSLRIATTNDLLDQKFLIISSLLGINFIVEYQKDGEERIIDYSTNLIMEKSAFFNLFQAKTINVLDKETLYRYHEDMEYLDDINLIYILLAGKEIMTNVNNKIKAFEDISNFCPNPLNDKVIGKDCDGIFLDSEDIKTNFLDEEIDNFTFNTTNLTSHIKKDSNYFYYQKLPFSKKIPFNTLDTYVADKETRTILQSENRYGHCHYNSIKLLQALTTSSYDQAYIISGKIKLTEYDYVYHSWVELTKDNKIMVIDFNRNVIMKKEDYYNMKKPIIINKTSLETINKLLEYEDAFNLYLPTNLEVYFNEEFIKDFEKNKSLIKK